MQSLQRASSATVLVDLHALPGGRGSQGRVEHLDAFDPIGKIGRDRATGRNSLEEIDDPVDEAVLVANDVAGRPPIRDVSMRRFGREDGAKALRMAGISA